MLKSGRERKLRRKKDQRAYYESHDNDLVSRMNREQEQEAKIYEEWRRQSHGR